MRNLFQQFLEKGWALELPAIEVRVFAVLVGNAIKFNNNPTMITDEEWAKQVIDPKKKKAVSINTFKPARTNLETLGLIKCIRKGTQRNASIWEIPLDLPVAPNQFFKDLGLEVDYTHTTNLITSSSAKKKKLEEKEKNVENEQGLSIEAIINKYNHIDAFRNLGYKKITDTVTYLLKQEKYTPEVLYQNAIELKAVDYYSKNVIEMIAIVKSSIAKPELYGIDKYRKQQQLIEGVELEEVEDVFEENYLSVDREVEEEDFY